MNMQQQKKVTDGELQEQVKTWGYQVSKTTIRWHLHANRLFGKTHQKKAIAGS